MKKGDRVEVIDETSPFYHHRGIMTGTTKRGNLLVWFRGYSEDVSVEFKPFDVELARQSMSRWWGEILS